MCAKSNEEKKHNPDRTPVKVPRYTVKRDGKILSDEREAAKKDGEGTPKCKKK